MLFNSPEFIFAFLPVVLIGFLFLQRLGSQRWLMVWLTAASLFFYAWWNPKYLLLLLLSCFVNYNLGVLMTRNSQMKSWLLVVGILFNILLLGYFKYANFFADTIAATTALNFNLQHIILPLAISFYTFVQITYLVDASRGLTKPHGWLDYLLFVSYFPHLIAGPIVHHRDLLSQWPNLSKMQDHARQLTLGGAIFVIGLFKKVVIADSFATYATPVFTMASQDAAIPALEALAGVFAYAFQLYFDFSGYSDMAIGLSFMFGIKLPVNFYSPFRAQNISEFWSTWHVTLMRFLREYIYMPLGGFLCSRNRQRFNLFTTMFVGGIWHGAGWPFVLYGVCHGVYAVFQQFWRVNISGPRGWTGNRYYRAGAQLLTFLVCVFTLVIFRADSVETAMRIYSSIWHFGGSLAGTTSVGLLREYGLIYAALGLALMACWMLPNTYQIFKACDVVTPSQPAGREAVIQIAWQPNTTWALFLAGLTSLCLMNLSRPSEFLYFQF
jgi:alginate O-acetyltransferase complex protein AlgI